jgi:hypothetical protein
MFLTYRFLDFETNAFGLVSRGLLIEKVTIYQALTLVWILLFSITTCTTSVSMTDIILDEEGLLSPADTSLQPADLRPTVSIDLDDELPGKDISGQGDLFFSQI